MSNGEEKKVKEDLTSSAGIASSDMASGTPSPPKKQKKFVYKSPRANKDKDKDKNK